MLRRQVQTLPIARRRDGTLSSLIFTHFKHDRKSIESSSCINSNTEASRTHTTRTRHNAGTSPLTLPCR